jgi:hypothetical protein
MGLASHSTLPTPTTKPTLLGLQKAIHLNQRITNNMTPELQKYYESRFEMMGMEGWKELCIDIDNMIESLNNLSVIPDEKTLMFKKGELSILTWLKTLKEVSERAYEELNEKNV